MTSQRNSLLAAAALALGCNASGDRVTFGPMGNGDAGVDGPATPDDVLFPNLDVGRDAIPARETSILIPEDAACATATADAMQRPMNLLFVLDRSGSMNNTPANPTKWASAVSALRALVMRLDDQTRVGLTFFPSLSQPDMANGYTTPAVPVGPLATTRATILSRLAGTSPNGNTPMTCAIQGTTAYYRGFTMDGSRNVILITDGLPTEECTDTVAQCGALPNLFDINAVLQWEMCRDRVGSNAVRVAVGLAQRETPPVRFFVAGTPEASNTFLSDLAVIGQSAQRRLPQHDVVPLLPRHRELRSRPRPRPRRDPRARHLLRVRGQRRPVARRPHPRQRQLPGHGRHHAPAHPPRRRPP
ncbi:MAG: vWA domain-containing protein [Polyangiales bacterium]